MTPGKLYPDRDSLFTAHRYIRHTVLRLRRSTSAATLLPTWEALYKNSQALLDKLRGITEKIEEAQAFMEYADAELLDPLTHATICTVRKVVGNDLDDPRYAHYTKGQTPSALMRPTLGPQLQAVRPWIESLKAAAEKELQELSAPLKDAVAVGDQATAAHIEAKRQEGEFRATLLVTWYEKLNAERKTLHGELLKLEADPSKKLPTGYAVRFFLVKRERRAPAETLVKLADEETEAEVRLKAIRDRKQAFTNQLEAERLAEAKRDQTRAELREIERARVEADLKAAELRRKLDE